MEAGPAGPRRPVQEIERGAGQGAPSQYTGDHDDDDRDDGDGDGDDGDDDGERGAGQGAPSQYTGDDDVQLNPLMRFERCWRI